VRFISAPVLKDHSDKLINTRMLAQFLVLHNVDTLVRSLQRCASVCKISSPVQLSRVTVRWPSVTSDNPLMMTSLSICVLQLHNTQRTVRGRSLEQNPHISLARAFGFPLCDWLEKKTPPSTYKHVRFLAPWLRVKVHVCSCIKCVCYSVCSPPLLVVCSLCSLCLDVCCVLLSSLHFPWQQIPSAFPLLILSPGFFGRTFCSQTSFRLFLFVSLSFSFCGHKVAFLHHMISSVALSEKIWAFSGAAVMLAPNS